MLRKQISQAYGTHYSLKSANHS